MSLIPKAIELAFRAHEGQLRDDGEPYVQHPLRVFDRFKQFRPLEDTPIRRYEELGCISLLHDVLEDSAITRAELDREFGAFVAEGVAVLTKVPLPEGGDKAARNAAYYAALHASAPDLQLIKLLDRLDNLASLSRCPDPAKRRRYLEETERVFLPWAEAIAPRVHGEMRFLVEDLKREAAGPAS